MGKLFVIILLSLTLHSSLYAAQIKNIVFDLDGVLLETGQMKTFRQMGVSQTALYFATLWRLPSQREFFSLLMPIPAISTEESYSHGLLMPPVLVDWQTGRQSNAVLLKQVQDHLNQQEDLPSSARSIYLNLAQSMFDPQLFTRTRIAIPEGIEFVHRLAQEGSLKIYVLSNWDKESFPLVKEKFASLFADVTGIMISGEEGALKPNKNYFEKFIAKYDLNPAETIFVDDEAANAAAAKDMGFESIHFEDDYSNLSETVNEILRR